MRHCIYEAQRRYNAEAYSYSSSIYSVVSDWQRRRAVPGGDAAATAAAAACLSARPSVRRRSVVVTHAVNY